MCHVGHPLPGLIGQSHTAGEGVDTDGDVSCSSRVHKHGKDVTPAYSVVQQHSHPSTDHRHVRFQSPVYAYTTSPLMPGQTVPGWWRVLLLSVLLMWIGPASLSILLLPLCICIVVARVQETLPLIVMFDGLPCCHLRLRVVVILLLIDNSPCLCSYSILSLMLRSLSFVAWCTGCMRLMAYRPCLLQTTRYVWLFTVPLRALARSC